MRYWSIWIFVLVSLFAVTGRLKAASIQTIDRPPSEATNVRAIDPIATEILERALDRSPSVQALVSQLEASDVIVHIVTSREMPSGVGGMTRFVTKGGGHRYLRVTVSPLQPWNSRIALLAHELKHACEVASSTAEDAAGMKRLFESAGFRPQYGRELFETNAAIRIESLVRMELRERRTTTLEAEPVTKFNH